MSIVIWGLSVSVLVIFIFMFHSGPPPQMMKMESATMVRNVGNLSFEKIDKILQKY